MMVPSSDIPGIIQAIERPLTIGDFSGQGDFPAPSRCIKGFQQLPGPGSLQVFLPLVVLHLLSCADICPSVKEVYRGRDSYLGLRSVIL